VVFSGGGHDPYGILDSLADGAEAITPAIWPFQVVNVLFVGERRKRVSMVHVRSALRRIGALPISVDPARVDHAFEQVLLLRGNSN
jgi:hypothetical protein